MIARASRSRAATLAALLLVPPVVIAQAPPKPPAPAARGPLVADTATGQRIRVTQVAGVLVHPYSLAFPDSHTILVAERSGRLRIIRDGVLLARPAWEAPPAPPGSPPGNNPPDALHFIELHPAFAQNRLVYLAYPKYGPRGNTIAVGRGKLTGDALVDFQEIFVSEAWESYGANPGRMLFGRDGTLYVTIGDRDRYCCDSSENNSQRMKAQTLDNDYGKILRIRDDGSIPPDNPFVGRAGALPDIFSYGHRNAYGLAYHPETGELWEAEIGPLGGDEINPQLQRVGLDALRLVEGPEVVRFRAGDDARRVGPVGGDGDHRQADGEQRGEHADFLAGRIERMGIVGGAVAAHAVLLESSGG